MSLLEMLDVVNEGLILKVKSQSRSSTIAARGFAARADS